MSARSKINQRRSNLERRAGGRFMFSAGVLLKSYLPLHKTPVYIYSVSESIYIYTLIIHIYKK